MKLFVTRKAEKAMTVTSQRTAKLTLRYFRRMKASEEALRALRVALGEHKAVPQTHYGKYDALKRSCLCGVVFHVKDDKEDWKCPRERVLDIYDLTVDKLEKDEAAA